MWFDVGLCLIIKALHIYMLTFQLLRPWNQNPAVSVSHIGFQDGNVFGFNETAR